MSDWSRKIEYYGEVFEDMGQIPPVEEVIGDGKAGVTMNIGMNFPFGDASARATVHLTCGQNVGLIQEAGERATMIAMELCKTGLELAIEERNEMISAKLNQGT